MGGLDDKIRRFLDSRNELLKEVRQEVEAEYQSKVLAPRLLTLQDEVADLKQRKTVAEDRVKRHWKREAKIQEAKNIIQHEEAKIKAECDELNALEPLLHRADKEITDLGAELEALKKKRAQDEEELLNRIQLSGVFPTAPFRGETPTIFPNNDPQPGDRAEHLPASLRTPQPTLEEGSAPALPHGNGLVGSELATQHTRQQNETTPITVGVDEVSGRHQSRKRRQGKYLDSHHNEEDQARREVQGSKRPKIDRTTGFATDTTVKISERTIPYDDVFADSHPTLGTTIIEHPPKSKRWFILWCEDHTRYFDSLASATGHLCQGEHKEKNCSYEKTHQMLGVRVLNCTSAKAKRNNDALSDPKNQSLQYRSPRTRKTTNRFRLPEPSHAAEEGGGVAEEGNEIPYDDMTDLWVRQFQRDDPSDPTYRDDESQHEEFGRPPISTEISGYQRLPKVGQETDDQDVNELIKEVLESGVLNVEQTPPRTEIQEGVSAQQRPADEDMPCDSILVHEKQPIFQLSTRESHGKSRSRPGDVLESPTNLPTAGRNHPENKESAPKPRPPLFSRHRQPDRHSDRQRNTQDDEWWA